MRRPGGGGGGKTHCEKSVPQVLVERCWTCPGGAPPKGETKQANTAGRGRLDPVAAGAGLLAGGDGGPSAVKGNSEDSLD